MLKIQINQNINLNEIIQFFLRIVINQLRFQCVSSFSWIFLERSSNSRACLNCTKKDKIFYEVASCRLFVIDDSHYSFGSLLRHGGESELGEGE